MSNVGQIALTIVGTVVGAYFGNPELGFALGSLAGSVLFPTQLPAGPRITDNRTTTASLGEPCPFGFGTFNVAGTVIALGPRVETKKTSSTKGGPEQTTYQYNQTIAIGLVESAIDLDTSAISTITRAWENGELVYDIRPQQEANPSQGIVAESDADYAARLTQSAAYADQFTLYVGTEDQMPDPAIEAIYGAGNVQAFRGLAYIVFPQRLLRADQGYRHPNWQFEVVSGGVGDCVQTYRTEPSTLHDWLPAENYADPRNPLNDHSYQIFQVDWPTAPNSDPGSSGNPPSGTSWYEADAHGLTNYPTLNDAFGRVEYIYGFGMTNYLGHGTSGTDGQMSQGIGGIFPGNFAQPMSVRDIHETRSVVCVYAQVPVDQDHLTAYWSGNENPNPSLTFEGGEHWYAAHIGLDVVVCMNIDPIIGKGVGPSWAPPGDTWLHTTGFSFTDPNDINGAPLHGRSVWHTQCAQLLARRIASPPAPPCYGLEDSDKFNGYCVSEDGTQLIKKVDWEVLPAPAGQHFAILQNQFTYGFNGEHTAVGPVRLYLNSESETDESQRAFWEAAYADALAAGKMTSGKVFPSDYPKVLSLATTAYSIIEETCSHTTTQTRLSDIIRACCLRAGLTSDQIIVDDMDSIFVGGYCISSLSSAADGINPTRSVGFWDAIETSTLEGQVAMRFQSRGKDIVATLTDDDIGAFDGQNASDKPPPRVSTVRSLDSELPRRIRFHYIAISHDYQPGEQDSPFRPTAKAVNDQDISIPIALDDTTALRAAQIDWADAWNGRTQHTVSTDQSWAALEVGDAIAIPVEGYDERVRVDKIQDSSSVLRKLTAVADSTRSYTSDAIAEQTSFVPPKIKVVAPTVMKLLDLPALQDADETAGFYVAVGRDYSSGNAWPGAQIYMSIDGGSTYTALFTMTGESTMGVISGAVAESQHYTWDDSTVITVTLPDDSLSFESRTDEAVLAGANAAAMGADLRWEIIQFGTATKVGVGTWHLTHLLRGRRGTEWVLGTSQSGDAFVLLEPTKLTRVSLNTHQIGNVEHYKAVTIGAAVAGAADVAFVGYGMALRPFSPVDLGFDFVGSEFIETDTGSDVFETDGEIVDPGDAPAPAVEAGYLMNTFLTSAFTLDNVDRSKTKASGKQWYLWDAFSAAPAASQITLNGDQSVTVIGSSGTKNAQLCSATRVPGGNPNTSGPWVGKAFGKGFYARARFKFDPLSIHTSNGWPSWWGLGLDASILYTSRWTGQSGAYRHQIETDFFEMLYNGDLSHYGGSLHDAYGVQGVTCPPNFCMVSNPSAHRAIPPGTNLNDWHWYGFRWIPATDSTQGEARWYFDDVEVGVASVWDKWVDDGSITPPPVVGTTAFARLDVQKQVLIFGTGTDSPMTVDRVEVWQLDESGNLSF